MLVKKTYERLVNLGNYENVKIGVTLEQDIKAENPKELAQRILNLGKFAQTLVNKEAEGIKKEGEKNVEQ